MDNKIYIRVFVAVFALWLSVTSFATALAMSVQNPGLLVAAFAKQSPSEDIFKDPKWLKEFDKSIEKADTLNLSYSLDGYAQNLSQESERVLSRANLASAGLAYNAGKQASEKTVLPVQIYIKDLDRKIKVDNPQSTKISDLNAGLKKAVLRYPGTATLNESGRNMLIFGHSSHLPIDKVFNKMYRAFNGIEKLKRGSKIYIYGDDGKTYVYSVYKVSRKSANNDVVYIATKEKKLTLITCDNFGAKEDRWVVEARFEYSK